MNLLAVDLFCGLGGWTDGLLAEGYDVIGFDIERHVYGEHHYPAQLVIQDVRTLHGSQFKMADLIVASPPCQEFSYMAMPWSRAKQIARALRGDDAFPTGYTGSRTITELTALFDACFRIQREACEAAGRHIPMVVENVRGAQPWVGRARWSFGSFYLWGDVPALMPVPFKGSKVPGFRFDGSGGSFQTASVEETGFKSQGMNWSDQTKRGQDFTRIAGRHAIEGRKAFPGNADGWFGNYAAMKDGIKQRGSGREWFAGDGKISRMTSSGSRARKFASAMIAKIPLPLSQHIAATCKQPSI